MQSGSLSPSPLCSRPCIAWALSPGRSSNSHNGSCLHRIDSAITYKHHQRRSIMIIIILLTNHFREIFYHEGHTLLGLHPHTSAQNTVTYPGLTLELIIQLIMKEVNRQNQQLPRAASRSRYAWTLHTPSFITDTYANQAAGLPQKMLWTSAESWCCGQ